VRRAPSDRPPTLVWALFLAATTVFVPLLVSAWLFLNLPPTAPALGPLGWPAGALRTAHSILLEPDMHHGWLVTRAPSSAPVACRFELGTLRPLRCHDLELRPNATKQALHHAFGEGSLLLVANESVERGPLTVRATLLRPGERPISGALWADEGANPKTDERAAKGPASLVNVAWNASARRFEAYLARASQGALPELFVLPFDPAGAALTPEPIVLVGARPPEGSWPLAIAASEPRGVFWATPREALFEQGEKRTVLPCRDPPAACVSVASPLAPTGHYAGSGSLWFDGRGEVKPLAPHFESSERWRQIIHVVARLSNDGSSSPFASRSISDEVNFGRLEASDRRGDPVGVLVEHRGAEAVLVVVDPEGLRHRIARDAHAPYNWTAVPHAGGLALFDFSSARGVVLDDTYQLAVPRARWAAMREVLSKRFAGEPALVVAFLFSLVAYPLLALWIRRARGSASNMLLFSLAAYISIVVVFLVQGRASIFPP
jgi:hypothetical protein